MYPTHLRYTKEHEWVLAEGGKATVGITDFAQSELGDIVYVELPEVGKSVTRGEVIGTIESVKAVSEIYAPLSGAVIDANTALVDRPELVNADAHGEGWICRIEVADPSELDSLMDAAAYEAHVGR